METLTRECAMTQNNENDQNGLTSTNNQTTTVIPITGETEKMHLDAAVSTVSIEVIKTLHMNHNESK